MRRVSCWPAPAVFRNRYLAPRGLFVRHGSPLPDLPAINNSCDAWDYHAPPFQNLLTCSPEKRKGRSPRAQSVAFQHLENCAIRENRPLAKTAFLAYITGRAVDFPTSKIKTVKELCSQTALAVNSKLKYRPTAYAGATA